MRKNISEIVDRIKSFAGVKNDGEVASMLGMTKAALSNHKKRGSIPYEALLTLCEKEGMLLDWLLTGEGPKERGEGPQERERLKAGETVAPYGAEANVRRLIEEAVVTAEDLAKAEGVSLTKEERAELVVAVYDELVIIEERKSKELKTGKVVEFFKRKRAS